VALVEHVAQLLLAHEDAVETDFDAGDGREASFRRVGDRRVGVDGRHLEGQRRVTDAGEIGSEHEQIRPVRQRRQHPREHERKREALGRIGTLGHLEHLVLEREQRARLDLEREVQIEWAATRLLGVQVDLPCLAQRVRLDEVTLVVDVELMVDGVVLQVGDEAGNVDDRQHVLLDRGQVPFSLPRLRPRGYRRPAVNDDTLQELLHDTATAVQRALGDVADWGLAGTSPGQHHSDLAADGAALAVLDRVAVGVVSEESGTRRIAPGEAADGIVVVIDPLDGSTNAAHGLPWFATSLCAVDVDGPRVALVRDLTRSRDFIAVRGGGARLDGTPLGPSAVTSIGDAIVGLSGLPPSHLGWRQYRSMGAIALDLCAVASGSLDAVVDCSVDAHGVWDYLGGALICQEAGASITDAAGRDLVALSHDARRTPIAAATPALHAALVEARMAWPITESQAASGD
jgi:myo-inositol-1(or 4)-monophosphatase